MRVTGSFEVTVFTFEEADESAEEPPAGCTTTTIRVGVVESGTTSDSASDDRLASPMPATRPSIVVNPKPVAAILEPPAMPLLDEPSVRRVTDATDSTGATGSTVATAVASGRAPAARRRCSSATRSARIASSVIVVQTFVLLEVIVIAVENRGRPTHGLTHEGRDRAIRRGGSGEFQRPVSVGESDSK